MNLTQIKNSFIHFNFLIIPLSFVTTEILKQTHPIRQFLSQNYNLIFTYSVQDQKNQIVLELIAAALQKINIIIQDMKIKQQMISFEGRIMFTLEKIVKQKQKNNENLKMELINDLIIIYVYNEKHDMKYSLQMIQNVFKNQKINKQNFKFFDNNQQYIEFLKSKKYKSFISKTQWDLIIALKYIIKQQTKMNQIIVPQLQGQNNVIYINQNIFTNKSITNRIQNKEIPMSMWDLKKSDEDWIAQSYIFVKQKKIVLEMSQFKAKILRISSQIYKTKGLKIFQIFLCEMNIGTPALQTILGVKKQKIPKQIKITHAVTKLKNNLIPYQKVENFNADIANSTLINQCYIIYQNQKYEVNNLGNYLFFDLLLLGNSDIKQLNNKLYFNLEKKHKNNKAICMKRHSIFNLESLEKENQKLKGLSNVNKKKILQIFGSQSSHVSFKQLNIQIRNQLITTIQFYKNTGIDGIIQKIKQLELEKFPKIFPLPKNSKIINIYEQIQKRFTHIYQCYYDQIRLLFELKWEESNIYPIIYRKSNKTEYKLNQLQQENHKVILMNGTNDEANLFFQKLKKKFRSQFLKIEEINCKNLTFEKIQSQTHAKLEYLSQNPSNSKLFLIYSNYNQIKNYCKINFYTEIIAQKKIYQSYNLVIIIGCPQYSLISNYSSWFMPSTQQNNISFLELYIDILPINEVYEFMKQHFHEKGANLMTILKQQKIFTRYFCQASIFQRIYTFSKAYQIIQSINIFKIYKTMFTLWWTKFQSLGTSQSLIKQYKQYLVMLSFRLIKQKKHLIYLADIQLYEKYRQVSTSKESPVIFEEGHIGFLHSSFACFIMCQFIVKSLEQYTSFNRIREILMDQFVKQMIIDYIKRQNLQQKLIEIVLESRYNYNYCKQNTKASLAISILNIMQYSFSDKDLSFVEIPYATLQASVLSDINFAYSNIKNTYFGKCHISNCNFLDARYTGKIYTSDYLEYKSKCQILQIILLIQKRAIINIQGAVSMYNWPSMEKQMDYKSNLKVNVTKIVYNGYSLFLLKPDKYVEEWQTDTGDFIRLFTSKFRIIVDIVIKNQLLVIIGDTQYIEVWNISTKKQGEKLRNKYRIKSSSFDQFGNLIACDEKGNLIMWDLTDFLILQNYKITDQEIKNLYIFGSYYILQIQNFPIQIFKQYNYEFQLYKKIDIYCPIVSIVKSKTSDFIAIATSQVVRIYTFSKFQFYKQYSSIDEKICSLVFDDKNNTLIIIKVYKILHLKIFESRFKEQEDSHSGQITCLVACDKLGYVLSGSTDRLIKVWSINKLQFIRNLGYHNNAISNLKIFKDTIISASYDHIIKWWDLINFVLLYSIQDHHSTITCLLINPLRNILISGSKDTTFKIWEFVQKQKKLYLIRTFQNNAEVTCLQIFEDQKVKYLAAGQYGYIKIFNEYDILENLKIHSETVVYLRVSKYNIGICISSSIDGSIKIWEINTGNIINQFDIPEDFAVNIQQISKNELIVSTYRGIFMILNIKSNEQDIVILRKSIHQKSINTMVYFYQINEFITGSSDFTIKRWKLTQNQHKQKSIWFIKSIPLSLMILDCVFYYDE